VAKTFALEVITPERVVASCEVEYVTLPSVEGIYGILADHAPMVGALKAGVVHYRSGGRTEVIAVTGGFFETTPRRTVILADQAELPEEIDVAAAIEERDRQRRILEAGGPPEEMARVRLALERAMARIRAAGQR
jgi:F-type H+-transporting ATPase subunit epsilon